MTPMSERDFLIYLSVYMLVGAVVVLALLARGLRRQGGQHGYRGE